MFNRNGISSSILHILLIVYWCEICLVNCEELLKFWEPDLDSDSGRRAEEHHKYRNKNEIFEKTFHHKRGKSIDNKYDKYNKTGAQHYNKQNHKSDTNEHHKHLKHDVERHRSSKKDHVNEKPGRDKIDDSHILRTNLKPDHKLLRGVIDDSSEEHKKNKAKHVKRNRRDSLPYESTRMTPMYLMQAEEDRKPKKKEEDPYYKSHLSPYAIAEQLKEIGEKFPEVNVTQEIIGRTVEYKDIVLLKITARQSEEGKYFRAKESKYTDEAQVKKIVFIVHGLSVMGMATLPCLSETEELFILLSYYFAHLDKFDIFLIPMANPDGYMKSLELWNKNMSPQNACPGVALDRNFEVAWNVSRDESSCNHLYPGPSAFSEAETRAIRDVFHHYSHKIIAYFHVHSGTFDTATYKGDAILYPKGYLDVQTDDDKYIDLKGEVEEAMKNASFQVISVTVDTLFNWYTKVSGTSVDYASTVYGIPYALELVMQLYENDQWDAEKEYQRLALTEIWQRLIDVVFNNIWRNTQLNNDNK